MTIDDYIAKRNEIQLTAEAKGIKAGREQWTRLGIANRHISRVLEGILSLTPAIETEIQRCLDNA